MQWFSVAIVVLFVALNVTEAKLTADQVKKELEISQLCMKEHKLTPEDIKKVLSKDFKAADKQLKCFVKCVLEKVGVVNGSGELQVEKTVEILSKGNHKAKATEVVNKCKVVKSTDPCDRAFELVSCYEQSTLAKNGNHLFFGI